MDNPYDQIIALARQVKSADVAKDAEIARLTAALEDCLAEPVPPGIESPLVRDAHLKPNPEPPTIEGPSWLEDRVYQGGPTSRYALTSFPSGAILRRVTVQDYGATPHNQAALQKWSGDPIFLEDVVSQRNLKIGCTMGGPEPNVVTLLGGRFAENGQSGLSLNGTVDSVVDGALCERNNEADENNAQWDAGGSKFVQTTRLRLIRSVFRLNNGPGLWADIRNRDLVSLLCEARGNAWAGIMHELGYGAEFGWFRSVGNGRVNPSPGKAGVLFSNVQGTESRPVEAHHGYVEGPVGLMTVFDARRSIPSEHHLYRACEVVVRPSGGDSQWDAIAAGYFLLHGAAVPRGLTFDDNYYRVPATVDRPFLMNDRRVDFDEWRRAGYDPNSVYVEEPA